MTKFRFFGSVILIAVAAPGLAQTTSNQDQPKKQPEAAPYANMPVAAVPYRNYKKAYEEWFVRPDTLEYNGAARNVEDGDISKLQTINLGFLGPLGADNPESPYGIAMLHGAEMAIDDANAQGGYRGKPFALKIHDDLPLWGASSMEIVKMDSDEHVWAVFGSVDGASTHIALRATLKLEIPMVNTAATDPTDTETRIQWLLRDFPDDRQQGYALADYIFNQRKLQRIAIIRANNRYARIGFAKFFDMARRMGHQPLVVVKYGSDEQNVSGLLQRLYDTGMDGLVIWGSATEAGKVVKEMRSMGFKQPVFGSSRVAYPELMKVAGPAAEGLVAVCAMDPSRNDPKWQNFRERFLARYKTEPDAYASYAYDGMTILIGAVRKAGLNRGRIMDALREYGQKKYEGVSGEAYFDYTLNNIAPVTIGEVKNGAFVYWPERRTDRKDEPVAFVH